MIEAGSTIRARRSAPAARALALLTAFVDRAVPSAAVAPTPAHAQSLPPGLPIIRDAEIEQLLRDYTQPILRAAGLAQQNVQVIIINDRSFNAFVMDGRHIFINAGALIDAKVPNEVIGVLAHETGHMAGGHLSRLRQQLAQAQVQSIIAHAARRRRHGGRRPRAAMPAIRPPRFSARRKPSAARCLSYQRAQEEQADRAGVKFLAATGQSAKGMYDTFKRLSDRFCSPRTTPIRTLQSHPMPADRVAALEILAKASPNWDKKDPPELQLRHDLMRAKLTGFLDRGDTVARRYPLRATPACRRATRARSQPTAMPICAPPSSRSTA